MARMSRENEASTLTTMAGVAVPFKTPDHQYLALVPDTTHDQTDRPWMVVSVKNKDDCEFGEWLRHLFYQTYHYMPGEQTVKDAVGAIYAQAKFGQLIRNIFVRVGYDDQEQTIVLDLANDERELVHITKDGWSITTTSPLLFRRPKSMAPLPRPVSSHETLESLLRPFFNVSDDSQWILIAGWLVALFQPYGSVSHLALFGQQGSGKTQVSKFLRSLVDPNATLIRARPKNEQDLLIAGMHNYVLAFDNLSYISEWLSDAFCRLATGAGMGTRTLYTDVEETTYSFRRSVILNGIREFTTRPDLLERTMVVSLSRPQQYRGERQLQGPFDAQKPVILGLLCDIVSFGLAQLERGVDIDQPPRMRDTVTWIEACAPALGWYPGQFLEAYDVMRRQYDLNALDSSPIAEAVILLLQLGTQIPGTNTTTTGWHGSLDDLWRDLHLPHLRGFLTDPQPRGWPRKRTTLADQVNEIAPALKSVYQYEITIRRLPDSHVRWVDIEMMTVVKYTNRVMLK